MDKKITSENSVSWTMLPNKKLVRHYEAEAKVTAMYRIFQKG